MTNERLHAIAGRYPRLRIGVVGDYFLDRYLHIDPAKAETSIETSLPVHNVVKVRAQPGAAGTILNNLVALGIGEIHAVGFCGDDGEGYELRRALEAQPGVRLEHFVTSPERATPVYCKPLVFEAGQEPHELSRLDTKNWTPTPDALQQSLAELITELAPRLDVLLLLDQVELPETGVVTQRVTAAVHAAQKKNESLLVLADSRRGLHHFPPLGFKMNAAELGRMTRSAVIDLEGVKSHAADLARSTGRPVFVTLAEQGIVGALAGECPEHVMAQPVRGPIDVVGAGDAVMANLASALAAGADVREAMELAMAAASLVIHQIGTTGAASVSQIAGLMTRCGGA
jgi:rfaE bifunctional protein kinase chain/domain